MKNKQIFLIFFLSFQLFILALLVGFSDVFNTNILSMLSILLCFITTCFLFCKTLDYCIMFSGMTLTLISKILLFSQETTVAYLTTLTVIQILYFFRSFIQSSYKKQNIIVRISTIPICLLSAYFILKDKFDVISFVFILYMINLFLNILFTIKDIGINNFFPIGLLFLFIHASLVMFLNIDLYTIVNIPFIDYMQEMSFNISQIIYIIAQVILTCSIFTVNRMSFSKLKNDN